MKKKLSLLFVFATLLNSQIMFAQKTATGNSKDFKVKICLHSISYAAVWRDQSRLNVDDFLVKAKEVGFDGIMLVAKRPHV